MEGPWRSLWQWPLHHITENQTTYPWQQQTSLTNKANWQRFKTLYNRRLVQDPKSIVLIKHFTETLITIANETIPKTPLSNRRNTPWLNNECKIAIRLWNAALRKSKKEPLTSNLNSFKLLRAKTRKTIKQAKKISWQNYVNKLNSSTKTNSLEKDPQNFWQKPVYSSETPHWK